MCDQHTEQDNAAHFESKGITRRAFNTLAAGASLAMLLPSAANAMAVTERDVSIVTPDGNADAYFVHPQSGAHAAVLVWPDILGLRPAFRAMSKRLAESGYAVLCVNPYYRTEPSPVVPNGATFSDPAVQEKVFPLYRSLDAATNKTDAIAFIDWLDQQSAVDTARPVGTMGYCMGGPIIMRTAAAVPDRVAAAASFHGGGLATDNPDSPHLLIPKMKANFLIAVAANDDERNPEEKETLRESFADNGIRAEIEVYEDTLHGWCPPDSAVYNEQQAERAWSRLLALFDTSL